jgi:hypothetical protein
MSPLLNLPCAQRVMSALACLRTHLATASAIAYAVAHVREPSPVRLVAVALRLLALARADRYAITNFYLLGIAYIWRDPDGGLRAPSLAEAVTDEDPGGERFTLTNNGAVLAEWNGAAARALLALGTFAGEREDSPYASPDDRFDFEFPDPELLAA